MKIRDLYPILKENRLFTVHEVADFLNLSTYDVSISLTRYVRQGHIKRIKRGMYMPIPPGYDIPEESATNDPLSLVPLAFPDGYVGGWSAATYWKFVGLVSPITCILTKNKLGPIKTKRGGFLYHVFSNKLPLDSGIETFLHNNIEIRISDPHKTMIDMLLNPKCGGGIAVVAKCFSKYMSDQGNHEKFLQYAQKVKIGAFFKRLGYLTEILLYDQHPLCAFASQKISSGYSKIDHSIPCEKLITRWNLYIPTDLSFLNPKFP